jgi:transposase
MKKHSYRIVKIQELCVTKMLAGLEAGTELTFAIDVAKSKMVAVFADGGQVLATVTWQQPEQTKEVLAILADINCQGFGLIAVMEPTGTYGDPLRQQLLATQIPVYLASAKHVHDAGELYDGVPSKHDAKDSAVLAWLQSQGKTRLWPELTESRCTMRALVDEREMYSRPLQRAKNQMEALLARHFPEALSEMNTQKQKSSWALLAAMPSPAQIAGDKDAARAILRKVSKNSLGAETIERIVTAASGSTGAPMCLAEEQLVSRLAAQIAHFDGFTADADLAIAAVVASEPRWRALRSLLGNTTTAVVLAYVGDPSTFSSATAWRKAMGLNLREHSSGMHQGKLKLTKRGPGIVRQYLYYASMRLVFSSPIAQAWYQARGKYKAGVKNAALLAVTRKLAIAIFHVGRGADFDAAALFDTRKLMVNVNDASPRRRSMSCFPPATQDKGADNPDQSIAA